MSIPVFGKIEPGRNYVERAGAYGFLQQPDRRIAVVETSMGLFLPGGGADPGETLEEALKREIFEEIGLQVTRAHLVNQAIQYHWSEFYKEHFKKVGSFFQVEVKAFQPVVLQHEHSLHWLTVDQSARLLSQEFQRWAVTKTFVSI